MQSAALNGVGYKLKRILISRYTRESLDAIGSSWIYEKLDYI